MVEQTERKRTHVVNQQNGTEQVQKKDRRRSYTTVRREENVNIKGERNP